MYASGQPQWVKFKAESSLRSKIFTLWIPVVRNQPHARTAYASPPSVNESRLFPEMSENEYDNRTGHSETYAKDEGKSRTILDSVIL